jgi:hypothetical protein
MMIRQLWEDYQMNRHYEGGRLNLFAFAADVVLHYTRTTICRYRGHAWVDCSYAGPDSGNMDMYCERCGYHFHHTLY